MSENVWVPSYFFDVGKGIRVPTFFSTYMTRKSNASQYKAVVYSFPNHTYLLLGRGAVHILTMVNTSKY